MNLSLSHYLVLSALLFAISVVGIFLNRKNIIVLLMAEKAVAVRVFAAPDASCGHGQTWSAATAYIRARLHRRFGDRVAVEHVELFTARSFDFPDVLAAIEAGSSLPIVQVDGRIVSEGGKLSESVIARAVGAALGNGN